MERQNVDSKIESAGEQAAGVFHTHVSSCTCQGPERTTRLCNLPPAGVWLAALTALSDQSAGEEQWEKGLRTVTRELQVGFALAPGARSAIWAVGRPCKLAAGLLRSPCSGTGLPYRALQLGRQNPSPRKPGFGMRLAKKKKAYHRFRFPQRLLEALNAKIHYVLSFKGRFSLCKQERVCQGSGKEA